LLSVKRAIITAWKNYPPFGGDEIEGGGSPGH